MLSFSGDLELLGFEQSSLVIGKGKMGRKWEMEGNGKGSAVC